MPLVSGCWCPVAKGRTIRAQPGYNILRVKLGARNGSANAFKSTRGFPLVIFGPGQIMNLDLKSGTPLERCAKITTVLSHQVGWNGIILGVSKSVFFYTGILY